ncbi:hypothetical protein DFO66_11280 [Brevibacterium sanguinis]|uniref:Uncharacterized protein n=2 Tax=Brevibacterium TaxID=1696 RepID=A0A366IE63_9MICO|nr:MULTISPECIES: hypothetical protein [Brevibacterium]RBP62976.1 hypothetical protein DFO66_11280 [Brevibacterium sanguinis]RBP69479.1 hypothetical protein DFO65_11213 [Brevibacterium celere]
MRSANRAVQSRSSHAGYYSSHSEQVEPNTTIAEADPGISGTASAIAVVPCQKFSQNLSLDFRTSV